MYEPMNIETRGQPQPSPTRCPNLTAGDETPLLGGRSDLEKGRLCCSDSLAGGGAGLLLYGSVDLPLQAIDIELSAACVNDAGKNNFLHIICNKYFLLQSTLDLGSFPAQ